MNHSVHPWIDSHPHGGSSIGVTAKWLSAHVPEGWILDAGCGNGALFAELPAARLDRCLGVDIAPGHAHLARENVPGAIFWVQNFLGADQFTFRPVKFAAIVALGWLHNDWAAHHATGIQPKERADDDQVVPYFLRAATACTDPGAYVIADWPSGDGAPRFPLAQFEAAGWLMKARLDADRFAGVFQREG